jgi:hypothetical protein
VNAYHAWSLLLLILRLEYAAAATVALEIVKTCEKELRVSMFIMW